VHVGLAEDRVDLRSVDLMPGRLSDLCEPSAGCVVVPSLRLLEGSFSVSDMRLILRANWLLVLRRVAGGVTSKPHDVRRYGPDLLGRSPFGLDKEWRVAHSLLVKPT
jgi:hypothetical protein